MTTAPASDLQAQLAINFASVHERIGEAADRAGRQPDDISVVAVCKTVERPAVDAAFALGQTIFGENRVQVAMEKFGEGRPDGMELHMIGSLQTNKARQVVGFFDLVHSLDRLSLSKELDKRARNADLVQPVLLQVNVGREEQKHGCAVEDVPELLEDALRRPNLLVQGVMTMAPFHVASEETRPVFHEMREITEKMSARYPEADLSTLSMGMTNDFEVAIEEGATMLRIGTALFHGDRS